MDDMLTVLEHRHYEPYGNLFAGTMAETPFGFTGEWRDSATGMYYLRARYYNPAIGTFVSQDALETPNRYAYVGGNVVNRVDPSGMIADLCGVPFAGILLQIPPTSTSIPSSCALRDAYAVDVLAYTAARETASIGTDLRSDYHALAALMLMQINAFRTPNQAGLSGYWTPIGVSGENAQAAFVQNARTNSNATAAERQLAAILVNGYCTQGNPLYFFSPQAPAVLRTAVSAAYPQVAANYTGLQGLASAYGTYETALKNEVSIHAGRVAQLQQQWSNIYVVSGGTDQVPKFL
jgi:RHS repeat-associated protein